MLKKKIGFIYLILILAEYFCFIIIQRIRNLFLFVGKNFSLNNFLINSLEIKILITKALKTILNMGGIVK